MENMFIACIKKHGDEAKFNTDTSVRSSTDTMSVVLLEIVMGDALANWKQYLTDLEPISNR